MIKAFCDNCGKEADYVRPGQYGPKRPHQEEINVPGLGRFRVHLSLLPSSNPLLGYTGEIQGEIQIEHLCRACEEKVIAAFIEREYIRLHSANV